MRFGIVMLPDEAWSVSARHWAQVEELGFDHAWTYDHLVWGGLPESPWFGAVPTLTAAATVTQRIRLGALVSSPNFRHPYTFLRDLRAIDDVSGGRVLCGLGTGGNLDSEILGEQLPLKRRVDRFHEFVPLLHRLMTEDHVTHDGEFYSTLDARTLPLADPVPMVIAANGPRSLRLAARFGSGWVTTGQPVESVEAWWAGVAELSRRLDDELASADRIVDRYLSFDASPQFSLESAPIFHDMVGRAHDLGFTDVIAHYPRHEPPYRGDPSILDQLDLHAAS